MRLALVYHQFITRGGLEGYLRELLSQFTTAGHQVELVTSLVDDAFRREASAVHLLPPPGGLRSLNARRSLISHFASQSPLQISKLKVDFTLGFGRTWRQDVHRAGGGCHAVYSRQLPWYKRLSLKNKLELDIEKKLYTGAQTPRFVVNAPMVGQEIQENYGVAADRITVIPTGVDIGYWKPAEGDSQRAVLKQQLHAGLGERPVLLFVSLDHARKGLDCLLQAMARPEVPKDAVLWIVGKGLSRDFAKKIHRLGLDARTKSFGRQMDLRPFYQAADLFVHPTTYDACANTVLQSLASGLPGVISVNDGAKFHITDGQNGFMLTDPHRPEVLADTIRKSLLAPRSALAAAARQTMLPVTWKSHVEQWIQLLVS